MGLPWQLISLGSLATASLIAARSSDWSKTSFLSVFAASWALQFFCWGLWATFLYPKLFSPFRDLPEPKNNSWIHGQYRRIADEPTGAPALDWCDRPFLIILCCYENSIC